MRRRISLKRLALSDDEVAFVRMRRWSKQAIQSATHCAINPSLLDLGFRAYSNLEQSVAMERLWREIVSRRKSWIDTEAEARRLAAYMMFDAALSYHWPLPPIYWLGECETAIQRFLNRGRARRSSPRDGAVGVAAGTVGGGKGAGVLMDLLGDGAVCEVCGAPAPHIVRDVYRKANYSSEFYDFEPAGVPHAYCDKHAREYKVIDISISPLADYFLHHAEEDDDGD